MADYNADEQKVNARKTACKEFKAECESKHAARFNEEARVKYLSEQKQSFEEAMKGGKAVVDKQVAVKKE